MCGRVAWHYDRHLQQWVKTFLEDDEQRARIEAQPWMQDRYNIPPGSDLPAAFLADDKADIQPMRWGFPLDGRDVFNTRIETALESPMWRHPMRHGRCVFPVSGFYEWRQAGGRRQPFFIHRRDEAPLLLAGVAGQREVRGEARRCGSIVTCLPNALIEKLHDRMPVVLEDAAAWIDPATSIEAVVDLAAPAGDVLEAYPVSPEVNDASHDGPSSIERLPTLDDPLA